MSNQTNQKKREVKLKDEPPPPPLTADQAKDRASFIRNEVAKVKALKKEGKTFDELKEASPEFANNYPHLFIMVTSDEEYDQTTLSTMLVMLDRMSRNTTTQHEASIAVGAHLAKNYMKPDNTKKD